MTTHIEPEAVDSNQAARLLGVSPATLRGWRSRGTNGPPYFAVSKTMVLYKLADIHAWLEAKRVVPAHLQVARQEAKPWEKRAAT